ncbi:MAG: DUF2752 domain-containing protein, partial [Actinotalea sp.]|nr:DUF2752 domain-containing protein [Actinotalea sp.]
AWWLGRALGVLPGRARAPRGPVAWPAWVLLAVVLAFGVARNLPALGPWLAPG